MNGVFGRGWLDDTHVIAENQADAVAQNREVDVVSVDGSSSLLGHGRFLGVLSGSA